MTYVPIAIFVSHNCDFVSCKCEFISCSCDIMSCNGNFISQSVTLFFIYFSFLHLFYFLRQFNAYYVKNYSGMLYVFYYSLDEKWYFPTSKSHIVMPVMCASHKYDISNITWRQHKAHDAAVSWLMGVTWMSRGDWLAVRVTTLNTGVWNDV